MPERFTTRQDLVFHRSAQNQMNEMLEVLVARDYDRRVGVIFQRYSRPAHGSACPGGTSVHEGLHTSFTYDFDSRQNDSLMRSTPMQDGLSGSCKVRDGHTGSSSDRAVPHSERADYPFSSEDFHTFRSFGSAVLDYIY